MQPPRHRVRRLANSRQVARFQQRQTFLARQTLTSYRFVENAHPRLLATIREKKTLDDALKAELNSVMKEAKERFKTAAVAQ